MCREFCVLQCVEHAVDWCSGAGAIRNVFVEGRDVYGSDEIVCETVRGDGYEARRHRERTEHVRKKVGEHVDNAFGSDKGRGATVVSSSEQHHGHKGCEAVCWLHVHVACRRMPPGGDSASDRLHVCILLFPRNTLFRCTCAYSKKNASNVCGCVCVCV